MGEPSTDTLVYCCGPEPLLTAVESRCARWPAGALHVERFAPRPAELEREPAGPSAAAEAFEVELARSGMLIQVSGQELQVSDGSLYPALHKLEQQGLITAKWKRTDFGRRAKFYALTRSGHRHLEHEAENWQRLSSAISRVVRLKEA